MANASLIAVALLHGVQCVSSLYQGNLNVALMMFGFTVADVAIYLVARG